MCYQRTFWYNLDQPDYNIKYISYFSDKLGKRETYVSLVGKPDFKMTSEKQKIRIFSEYKDGRRLVERCIDQLEFTMDQVEVTQVTGSVESYLHRGLCDFVITIVQSGETLRVNKMVEHHRLREAYLNLWMYLPPRTTNMKVRLELRRGLYMALKPKSKQKFLIVEGIDGTGKSSLLNELSKRREIHDFVCFDRYPSLSRATLTSNSLPLPTLKESLLTQDNTTVIILESNLKTCEQRMLARGGSLEPFEEINAQCYFRLRYRQIAALNGYHVMSNDGTLEELVTNVLGVLGGDNNFKLPSLLEMTSETFNGLPTVAEGESKIVKSYNDRFDLVRYKPSVYSHKRQRGGTVEGTDLERQKTTMNIMLLLAKSGISHTYWCIYNGFILADKIGEAPPVEVCVKGAHVGTHKHIYHAMYSKRDRFGNKLTQSNDMYPEPIVRFDWRNPNHILPNDGEELIDMKHTQIFVNPLRSSGKTEAEIKEILIAMFPNGVPLGDYAMCDSLADRFINVEESRKLVTEAFKTLSLHFAKLNIRFKDVCFMPTIDGDRLYGEVSQDCGRYEAIDPSREAFQKCVPDEIPWKDDSASLDKDVWRAGGSSDLVLEKVATIDFLD